MHIDPFSTIEGRHLVFAYASVILIQLGYAGWVLREWRKLDAEKKATKSID